MVTFRLTKNFLLLHFIVFIWGFTGILGKLISLPTVSLVWYRMLIAAGGIFVLLKFRKTALTIPQKVWWQFFGVGILIALHWVFFFESIKVSNVSVALACFSSGTLFASLLEPLFYRRRIIPYEMVFGLIVMLGLYIIFQFETQYTLGIVYSIISAFLSSLFTVINGKFVNKYDSRVISFYELAGGLLCITAYFSFNSVFDASFFSISMKDIFWLLLLGLICTAYAFVVGVDIMKNISPYTLVLTVNLEPVYAILFAWLIFGDSEIMSLGFYLGALIIIATIYGDAFMKRRRKKIEGSRQ